VFDVGVSALGENHVGLGAGRGAGDEALTLGVEITRVQQPGVAVVVIGLRPIARGTPSLADQDVRAAGDVAGVDECHPVARHLERLAVAVGFGNLCDPLEFGFGERTVVGPAVEFQRVARERECEFAGRRGPVYRRSAVPREERGNGPGVVEVAVADDDSFRVEPGAAPRETDRELRRVRGLHAEIEQEPVVDEDGTPADLAGPAEKPQFHRLTVGARGAWLRRFDVVIRPGRRRLPGSE